MHHHCLGQTKFIEVISSPLFLHPLSMLYGLSRSTQFHLLRIRLMHTCDVSAWSLQPNALPITSHLTAKDRIQGTSYPYSSFGPLPSTLQGVLSEFSIADLLERLSMLSNTKQKRLLKPFLSTFISHYRRCRGEVAFHCSTSWADGMFCTL